MHDTVHAAKEATAWLASEWGITRGIMLLIAAGVLLWWLNRKSR